MIDGEGIHQLGLISDRALAPGEEDRFAHDDFVDQLEALIRSGIDTANIALYGSWGAGKSSISRRLADRFRSGWDKKHFRFVELNAFKYVDTPLLRTFIYRIAEATVPGKLEHYHHQLYEHATKSKLKAPDGWGAVIRVTALLVFGLLAAVATLLLVLPAGSAYHAVLDVLRALAPSTIIVGVLVTAASRVLPNFSAENERLAPASAEQFEQLFRDLVREDLGISGEDDKRLVVFIDELDRCSAGEVARTLETLRTFVNIPGCIFIVAADQQVLEHALTEHVRQSTPADMINPYYSAGSGYLDKIFEYQLSLPALLPSRLVDFAAALVADVGGVWAELDDLDSVLSVLIPVHVRSPRRVKVLLNRFAMTYSVARKRVSAGSLGNDLPQRAPELAKLVCIRTEFPIFAAELERDARIVEVIGLCLLHDEDGDPGTEDNRLGQFELELRHRAKQVVHGEFAVDEILSEDESYDDEQEDALVSRAATATVRRAHAAQLVDYIRQTQAIHGPRQDLVNLESIGASFGADPAFAMDLESAALANQRRRVLDLMTTAEPDERRRGLLVLAALVRRSCGLDARNVMRSLLRACEDTNDPIDDVAPKIARQLEDSGATVGSEEIAGALRVAVLGGSVRLADELMARPELITSPQSRHRALRLSPRLLEGHRKELSSIAAYEAEHEAGTLAAILGGLSDTDATAVIAVAIDEIESVLAKACQEAEQESEQPDESEGSARLSSLLASIGELARALAGHGHKHAAERTLLTLVHLDAHQALALLDELQEELQPIVSETVVRALASDLRHREPASWRELLGKLDRDTLRTVTTVALQDNLASQWWKRWQKAGEDVMPELQPALGAVVELREMKPTGALPKLTEQIHSALAANFTTEDVAILQHLSRGASMLAEANMLEATLAPNLTVSRVGEIAAAELNPTLAAIELSEQLSEILRGTVHAADEEIVVGCAQALGNSPWVEPPWRELMRMFLDAALPPSLRNGAIDAQKLTALRNDYGVPAHAVIAVWLTGVKPEVPEALLVLRPWIAQPAPNEIREAIRDYTAALEPQQLTNLAAALTAGGLKRHPTRELLADVRYGEAEEATIGAAIVKLVDQASNQDTRAVLFELWEALQPVDPSVRKTLISEIMIPVASQGQGAYDLVRSRLKLATDPPHGTKQELVDRLLAAAPDEKRRKQMQSRMEDLGLRKRPGKRFGLIPR